MADPCGKTLVSKHQCGQIVRLMMEILLRFFGRLLIPLTVKPINMMAQCDLQCFKGFVRHGKNLAP